MTIKLIKGGKKKSFNKSISEFYWIYLSILANAHLPPGLSGHEGAWQRGAVHSCPKQQGHFIHIHFIPHFLQRVCAQIQGLAGSSRTRSLCSLLLSAFLHWYFRGRSVNYSTNHRKASWGQGILCPHCVSYFCSTLSRDLRCNIGPLIDSQLRARK